MLYFGGELAQDDHTWLADLGKACKRFQAGLFFKAAGVGSDPLNAGWFFKMKPSDATEMDGLMDETSYSAFAAAA